MLLVDENRSIESYLDKISTLEQSSVRVIKVAINSFEKFTESEKLIARLNSYDAERREHEVFDVLGKFASYLQKNGKQARTVRLYLTRVKPYLAYRTRLKIHSDDLKAHGVKLPRISKRKNYPLSVDDYKKILDNVSPRRKCLYMVLGSSGIRIGASALLRQINYHMFVINVWNIKMFIF